MHSVWGAGPRQRDCRRHKLHNGVRALAGEIVPRIVLILLQRLRSCLGRCCHGVCAAPARQAGGAFRGAAAGPVVGRLSSSESGGSGGGATGSGVLTSSTACGMNLAVGDSVLLDAGCLLCGDGARLGGARCAGGSLGMALTGGSCSGAACGCGFTGCPNDGAEVEVELEEAAVCNGRDRVGVADGDLLRLGEGNLVLPGVGERARCRPYPPLLVRGSVSGTPPRARWWSYDEAVGNLVQLMPMMKRLIAMVSLVVNDVWIMSMASDLVTNLKMDRCCT